MSPAVALATLWGAWALWHVGAGRAPDHRRSPALIARQRSLRRWVIAAVVALAVHPMLAIGVGVWWTRRHLAERRRRANEQAARFADVPEVADLFVVALSAGLTVRSALLGVADQILIGGGMCFTFFAALGHSVGSSLLEPDRIDDCKALLDEFGDRLVLPSDVVALGPGGKVGDPEAGGEVRNMGRSVPDGWMGLDIGPGSAAEFADHVLEASTVLWNGPMGVFEDPRFEAGTRSVAQAVADCRGFTVIGGGDSAAAIAQFGFEDQVDHISTGGGASLELIERGDLPGVEALRRAPNAVEADESDEFNE